MSLNSIPEISSTYSSQTLEDDDYCCISNKSYKYFVVIPFCFLTSFIVSLPFASTGLIWWIERSIDHPGIDVPTFNLICFGGFIFFNCVSSLVCSGYISKYSPRLLGLIGSVTYGVGLALLVLAFHFNQLWLYFVGYCVFLGIGGGICFLIALNTCVLWLDKQAGMAGSVLGAGLAAGTIFYLEIFIFLRNVVKPFMLGLILFSFSLVLILIFVFLRQPPSHNYRSEQFQEKVPTIMQVLKKPYFWVVFFMLTFGLSPGYGNLPVITEMFTPNNTNTSSISAGVPGQLSLYTSIVFIGYASGRIFLGPFADLIGPLWAFRLFLLNQATALLFTPFLRCDINLPTCNVTPFVMACFIQIFFFGGCKVILGALIKTMTSKEAIPTVLGLALCGAAPAGVIGTVVNVLVHRGILQYSVFCYIMTGILLFGFFLSLVIKENNVYITDFQDTGITDISLNRGLLNGEDEDSASSRHSVGEDYRWNH